MTGTTGLDPKDWFGKDMADVLQGMASDYRRLADKLTSLAEAVPGIGERGGVGRRLTATDIVTDALNSIVQDTPNTARLVKAAADYERHAGGQVAER